MVFLLYRRMLFTLFALLAMSTVAEDGVADGQMMYASCSVCHGAKGEGNDSANAPALAARLTR